MKIALNNQGDGWIIDHIANDFAKYSTHKVVSIFDKPDVFWSINPFAFRGALSHGALPSSCVSFIQIHHIDETKLPEFTFEEYNKADGCIVPNEITKQVASKYLSIPIYQLPYWLTSGFMVNRNQDKVDALRKEINPENRVLIGSFVKDGEGKRGDNPKYAKGADTLVEILGKIKSLSNIKVVLAGRSRNYVIRHLQTLNIPYVYLENCKDIPSLYDCLDWYISASRIEGGPQSVLEASYRKVKILSTNCGMVSSVLHPDCICNHVDEFVEKFRDGVDRIEYNYGIVAERYLPEIVIKQYDSFFQEVRKHENISNDTLI